MSARLDGATALVPQPWDSLQSLRSEQIFLTRKLQTKEETKLSAVCRLSPSPPRRSLHAPVNIERRQKPPRDLHFTLAGK